MAIVRALRVARWSAHRLFAAYAVATLVPVVLLGVVLTHLLQSQADSRGLSEGIAQARLVDRTAIAPLLDGDPTTSLAAGEAVRLQRTVRAAVAERQILRLRLRDLHGRIVFASGADAEDQDADGPVDDEALDAAHGETVAGLTRLNDDDPQLPPGPRVVEVYLPLDNVQSGARIGVLEMYLPYDPIASDIARGQRAVYLASVAGLALLWLCLLGVTASVIGHLRREIAGRVFLAEHDVLTGLPNRALFRRQVVQLSKAPRGDVVVALLCIERFQRVEEALGRETADGLLAAVAERLGSCLAHDFVLAALGRGEFAVAEVGGDVERWFADVRAVLREPIQLAGVPLTVDVTMGYDVAPLSGGMADGQHGTGVQVEALLTHAALARTEAQRTSRPIAPYEPAHDPQNATALSLLSEVRAAVASDQLRLHFQPKHKIESGKLSSVEALVRWQHPTRGLLFPDAFLPTVEETELMDELTSWVLRHACQAALILPAEVKVAVNISARSLAQPTFVDDVVNLVKAEGVLATRLILEITETAVISDNGLARATLQRLRRFGFAISLDDFGIGQTSLSQLVTMPIDELKIDRLFVGAMDRNGASAAVVRAIVELGHSLNISVTAEGVETDAVLTELRLLGCDVAQGYLFSRPVPLDQLLTHRPDEPVPTPA